MKLATVEVETPVGPVRRVAAVLPDAGGSDDELVDVTTAYAAALDREGEADPVAVAEAHAPTEMLAFLRRGDRALEAARDALEEATAAAPDARGPDGGRLRFSRAEDGVSLLSPLPRPNSLRDFMAFEEHVRNSLGGDPPDVWYERPVYYKSNPDSVVGPDTEIEWPAYSDQRDYELEIAAVVGTEGQNIPAAEAHDHIVGYTVFDDFSARDAQFAEMQGRLGPAKGKDFANALGPYLVTADDPDFAFETATMTAEVNGERWSEGVAGEMYHSFADIVEHVSQAETLSPGDVLGSGTVGGGCGLELGNFLEPGDEVVLEIEGIGRLQNRIVG